jgi:hypothetical protein
MAPSADVTNSDIWAHPGIHWSCNRIDNNALLGIKSTLTTIEGRSNTSSSFAVSSSKIAPNSSTQNQVDRSETDAAAGLSAPSYTRFQRFFRKLKHALCEFVEVTV